MGFEYTNGYFISEMKIKKESSDKGPTLVSALEEDHLIEWPFYVFTHFGFCLGKFSGTNFCMVPGKKRLDCMEFRKCTDNNFQKSSLFNHNLLKKFKSE